MTPAQVELALPAVPGWHRVWRRDPRALALADRHYSRQSHGSDQFMPPGRVLVLLTADGLAVWGACENLDPAGGRRWRVTIFRNEGPMLSSDLVRAATEKTRAHWIARYGGLPGPLETEVDPRKTRRKRDPGRCFRRAGWVVVGRRRGLVVLRAPEATA